MFENKEAQERADWLWNFAAGRDSQDEPGDLLVPDYSINAPDKTSPGYIAGQNFVEDPLRIPGPLYDPSASGARAEHMALRMV